MWCVWTPRIPKFSPLENHPSWRIRQNTLSLASPTRSLFLDPYPCFSLHQDSTATIILLPIYEQFNSIQYVSCNTFSENVPPIRFTVPLFFCLLQPAVSQGSFDYKNALDFNPQPNTPPSYILPLIISLVVISTVVVRHSCFPYLFLTADYCGVDRYHSQSEISSRIRPYPGAMMVHEREEASNFW